MATELKEINSDFHRAEQEPLSPTTVQPKRQPKEEPAPPLGYRPAVVFCHKCGREVTTDLTFHITDLTHLSVFICSVLTWPCLACAVSGVPYCVNACQKVDHHCPHCKSLIGKHAKFSLSKIMGRKK